MSRRVMFLLCLALMACAPVSIAAQSAPFLKSVAQITVSSAVQPVVVSGTNLSAPLTATLWDSNGNVITPTLSNDTATSFSMAAAFNVTGTWYLRVKHKNQYSNTLAFIVSAVQLPPPPPPPPQLFITCPAPMVLSTDGTSLAVTYNPAQTSGGSGTVTVTYSPPSGTVFQASGIPALVTATASDQSSPQQTVYCSFSVTVNQNLVLTVPPNQTAISLDGNPVVVNYPPATTTGGMGSVTITYDHPSGSFFSVGTPTTVNVTASDQSAPTPQVKTGSFTVTVTYTAPPPASTSPDGTTVPPATQIVDAQGAIWTIGANAVILENGAQAAGGLGSEILWKNSTIYVLGTDSHWYQWTGSGWTNIGTTPPNGTSPPTPPTPVNGVASLTSDVTLTGSQDYALVGTVSAPITLQANGHRFIWPDQSWSGSLNMPYVTITGCGDSSHFCFGNQAGTDYAYINGGSIAMPHSSLHASSGINLYTVGAASIDLTDFVISDDNVWPTGSNDQAVPAIFTERGTSSGTKVFSGKVYKSWAFFGSPGWLVGSRVCTPTSPQAIFIGQRAGFGLGQNSEAGCFYSHSIEPVTPTLPYWADVENIHGVGVGSVMHDFILNTGQWMTTGLDGEIVDGVYANGGGHDYIRIGNGGIVHRSIFYGATGFSNAQRYGTSINYAAVPGEYAAFDLVQTGNHFSIDHDTIDLTGQVEHGCARAISGTTFDAYQNTVCNGVALLPNMDAAAISPDYTEGLLTPPPVRLGAASHNATIFAGTPGLIYDLATAAGDQGHGDVTGPPQFRGPLPIAGPYDLAGDHSAAFPFNDADIINGVYTIADMLAYHRWVFAPAPGSPLIGAASDGTDIGAVQTATLPATAPTIVTTNKRPVVSAGPSFTTGVSLTGGSDADHAELVGWGADDGLPNGVLTFQWTQVSGPATATFDFPTRSAATATFPVCGVYVLQLAVSDGVLTSTDQATITKNQNCTMVAHPRIWLPLTLATMKQKAAVNDPDWQAILKQANALKSWGVDAYVSPTSCSSTDAKPSICYPYEGGGWQGALQTLATVAAVTGDGSYATKALQIIAAMVAAGPAPVQVDSGFPERSVVVGLSIAYDYLYPWLDATTKQQAWTLGNAYFDWAKTSGLDCNLTASAASNYLGGCIEGFGLFAIATAGDNPRAAEIGTYIRSLYDGLVVPAITTGFLKSGYPPEVYTYGVNHFVRLLGYTAAVQSATGEQLAAPLAQKLGHSLIYNEKPNGWQFTDEGDYGGNDVAIPDPTLMLMIPALAPNTPDAGFAQSLYLHLAPNPVGRVADPGARLMWFNAAAPTADPSRLPKCWFSDGDMHLYCRDKWTDAAVWSMFSGGAAYNAGHQARAAGNVELQRGNDNGLLNGGQCKGPTNPQAPCVTGDPQTYDLRSWRLNTLAYQNPWSDDYKGGQGDWGTNNVSSHAETTTYGALCSDLTSAYTNTIPTGLVAFRRCDVNLLDGNVVDISHVVAPNTTDLKMLSWHTNPVNGAPTRIDNQTATWTVGTSTFWLHVASPSTVQLIISQEPVSLTDPKQGMGTYRIDAIDSATSPTLDVVTVLSTFATGNAPPIVTSLGPMAVQVGARQVSSAPDASSVTVK